MAGKKVLLVETNSIVREAVLSVLRDRYEIDGAADDMEALEKFERSAYDVIVANFKMPGMNGLVLAETLRKRGFRGPIFLTTDYDRDSQEWIGLHRKIEYISGALVEPYSQRVLVGPIEDHTPSP